MDNVTKLDDHGGREEDIGSSEEERRASALALVKTHLALRDLEDQLGRLMKTAVALPPSLRAYTEGTCGIGYDLVRSMSEAYAAWAADALKRLAREKIDGIETASSSETDASLEQRLEAITLARDWLGYERRDRLRIGGRPPVPKA